MSTRAVALVLLMLPGAVSADDRAATRQPASLVDAALAKHVTTFTEQRRRRRGGAVRSTGTRRSFRRIITGASLAISGALVARTAHTRIGEIDARNSVRDEWNEAAARVEDVAQEYDRECRRFTERCIELILEMPTLLLKTTTLAQDFPFLPQMPDVGAYITDDEEEQLYAWATTTSMPESNRRWNTTFYSGLAATGVGALLATVWSDVPVVRNLRVYPTPTRMTVSTTVGW